LPCFKNLEERWQQLNETMPIFMMNLTSGGRPLWTQSGST